MTPERAERVGALLREPSFANQLPAVEAAAILAELVVVQAALAARLAVAEFGQPKGKECWPEDRLLSPREAAVRLDVPVRWLYRHASGLSFTKRLSPRVLKFSEAGLRRYLAMKAP